MRGRWKSWWGDQSPTLLPRGEQQSMSGDPGLGRRRVLVVEDNGTIASEIVAAVEALGCTVLGPADSVAAALRLLTGRWPDAALLDVQLGPRSMSTSIAEV